MKTIEEECEFSSKVPASAEVGIEVEVEANKPINHMIPGWHTTEDNSLRGPYNCEFVLDNPLPLDGALSAIKSLREGLKPSDVLDSLRAGVHVHINVRKFTRDELLNFVALYYILEEPLTEWCGENRVNNHFCLRYRDAEAILNHVISFFKAGKYGSINADQVKYAALNYSSIPKYGSIEFRQLQTYPNLEKLSEWVSVLVHLKNVGKDIGESEFIIEQFSQKGPIGWAQEIMGDHFDLIKDQFNLEMKLHDGMRVAQDVIFFSKG